MGTAAVGISEIAGIGGSIIGIAAKAGRALASVAAIVNCNGDVKTAIPVGAGRTAGLVRVGNGKSLQTGVELSFGRTGDGDCCGAGAGDSTTAAADCADGALTDSDRRGQVGSAVIVGIDDVKSTHRTS